MNLLSQLNQTLNRTEQAFATVTGQHGGGIVVAKTSGGSNILLKGEMETGKKVFYNRRDSTIISEAPDVVFSEFGI